MGLKVILANCNLLVHTHTHSNIPTHSHVHTQSLMMSPSLSHIHTLTPFPMCVCVCLRWFRSSVKSLDLVPGFSFNCHLLRLIIFTLYLSSYYYKLYQKYFAKLLELWLKKGEGQCITGEQATDKDSQSYKGMEWWKFCERKKQMN